MIFEAKPDPYKREQPPFVPSKFAFVVHYGIPHQVYYHGTHLDIWKEECGDLLSEVVGDLTLTGQGRLADGAYLWEGHIESSVSYEGEHDAWLEADTLRLLTKEEWEDITSDNIPWDWEAVRACQAWYDKVDKEEQSEYFGTNLSEDLPTLLAMVRRNERKMLDDAGIQDELTHISALAANGFLRG